MLEKKGLLFEKGTDIFLMKNRRGQIWVETVIYTLISFALMGLVLAFVIPKIQETQDKGIIEQSIGVLQDIDSVIKNLGGPGNQRVLELGLNKGSLTFNSDSETIVFYLEGNYQYSQPGENVSIGKIIANTNNKGKINILTLTLNYNGEYNLTLSDQDSVKTISKSPVPYKILISDLDQDASGKTIVNIGVII
jgi:type II secretory pathway pseudopilin PulG